jgi:hypothetical protein
MPNSIKRNPKAGKSISLILLILGGVLTLILISLVATASSLPKILVAGPCFIGVGIGMLIFSGGNITLQEMKKNGAKSLWTEAPLFHKIAWIISGLIGLGISFKIMIGAGFL